MGANDPTPGEMFEDAIGLFGVGRTDDALHRLDLMLQQDDRHPGAWYYKGRCFQETGDLRQALSCFETAARLAPDYAAAHCEIGFCLNAMGRYRDALPYLADASRLDPAMDAAIINSGYAYERLGQFAEAVACHREILSRDRLNPVGWQNLGSCLLMVGQPREALECFQDAYELGHDEQVRRAASEGIERCRALLGAS